MLFNIIKNDSTCQVQRILMSNKIEEPRRKQRGFYAGMEYVNHIVRPTLLDPSFAWVPRVPAAINSGVKANTRSKMHKSTMKTLWLGIHSATPL